MTLLYKRTISFSLDSVRSSNFLWQLDYNSPYLVYNNGLYKLSVIQVIQVELGPLFATIIKFCRVRHFSIVIELTKVLRQWNNRGKKNTRTKHRHPYAALHLTKNLQRCFHPLCQWVELHHFLHWNRRSHFHVRGKILQYKEIPVMYRDFTNFIFKVT